MHTTTNPSPMLRPKRLLSPLSLSLMALPFLAGELSAGALYLDGVGSYVSFVGTGIPSGGSAFTIEAWINPTTIPTGGENGGQITFWGNETGNQANGFRLRGASGTRHFFWGNDHDANFGIDILPDSTGPNGDGWHHLALTYNGTQTIWYWNGNVIGTRSATAGVNVQAVNHRIGSRPGGEFFNGFIDEVRIWNTARTGNEITADLTHSLNGTEANLVAYFDFEGNLGDRAGSDNNGTALGSAAINPNASAPISTAGPRIYSFTASTNLIMIGNPVMLSWKTTNATWLSIDNGVGVVTGATNSIQVIPFTTTSYTLTASNEFGVRTALVTVNVDPGIPVANPQGVATVKNTPVNITLTASDPNGNNLTYSVVAPPQYGNLVGTPPSLVYTPTNDYFGNDFFTFKVHDGTNDSPAATVSIRIEATPTPPSAIVLSTTNIIAAAAPGSFLAALRAVDANPLDTHTFALVAGVGSTHNGLFGVSNNVLRAGPGYSAAVGSNYFIRLRTTDSVGLTFEDAFVLRGVEAIRNVVINEINYNGPNNTVLDEFIELHNPKADTVDISSWRLKDGVDFVFAPGTVIPPGGYLVVAGNPGVLLTNFGVTALGPWTGALNRDGERITLRDGADNVIDEVDYRSEFPWPIAANGGGGSMELIHPLLDNDLGSSWATPMNPPRPSPGQANQVLSAAPAPNIRQVDHSPKQPSSTNTVVITAKVTDPEGVASVVLNVQVVLPGNFIPATLPLTKAELDSLTTNPTLTNSLNPVFEATTNWISVVMRDDGLNGDAVAGDDVYSVTLPPQAHRTLVRYRIVVTDSFGSSRRAPFEDDPSLNFAYFVYDGIPDFMGVARQTLETLPLYQLITRDADINQCTAWFNTADQLTQGIGSARNEGYTHFNWEGAVFYDGVVYDHVTYRLRGANGRYHPGKRSFRIRFNDGLYLVAKDQFGKPYPTKWRELSTAKGQSNRGNETFSLNEAINYYLFNKVGVPAPDTFHFHFRVIRGVAETNQYTGDFWGIAMGQEKYDVNFLDAHNLPHGNLYKLVDNFVLGVDERRYQAAFAVTNAADFFNIENNLDGNKPADWLNAYANYTNWYRFHAITEGIRNYDTWPSANKNCAWYFEPTYSASNNFFGRLMYLPYDMTDTWGPTWNGGQDVLHNGIFNDSSVSGGDAGQNLEMQKEYRNVVREIRDLLFQPDQLNSVIDAFAARMAAFVPADLVRWSNAPAPARYLSLNSPGPGPGLAQGLPGYAQDLKTFMFTGGNAAWWIDRQAVSAGGWATRLDQLATDADIPATPGVLFAGIPGFPITGLSFRSSAYSDPQGSNTFAAMQWRIAEVQDTNVSVADLRVIPLLEWDAVWSSAPITNLQAVVTIPPSFIKPLKLYRVRVRHLDNTGRWSKWSAPFIFYPTPADVVTDLQRGLVFSEIMFNPPNFGVINGDDLEFLELKNTGSTTLDLTGLYFSVGINFTFTDGTTLAPGETFLLGRNAAALATKYPGIVVNGIYTGKLDNGGETIAISNVQGVEILSVSYNDRPPWPVTPDGSGFSLVRDPASGTYRPSANLGGSPGATDPDVSTPPIVINEILANSEPPAVDQIELFNPTAAPVNLGGWFLSDDPAALTKFRFTNITIIPAGGYLVVDESQFNPAPGTSTSFALGSGGDDLYLCAADAAGNLLGYTHSIDFGASETGVSLGHYLTSDGRRLVVVQSTNTFVATNAAPRVGPLVIGEIMYHPPDVAGTDDSTNEFIEVLNISGTSVLLYDPAAPTNTWQLKGGVDFVFPTNQSLEAGGYLLLVNFDPTNTAVLADFRARYGVSPMVPIFGPYSGKLNNANDDVELQKPILLTPTNTGYVLMDKVDYHDDLPWPKGADGNGPSLQRLNVAGFGNDPINWIAALPTAAAPFSGGLAPVITTPPTNQLAQQGQMATFSVGATGAGPLRYQWWYNGGPLPGATNAILMMPSAQPANNGTYEAVVFNSFGSAVSTPATLSVRVPAFIMSQPQTVSVRIPPDPAAAPTTNVTFTVNAYSPSALRYQWRFNNVDIAYATNTSHTIVGVQTNHWGDYSVAITDGIGTIVSEAAWLLPLVKPAIVQNPLAQTIPVSSVVSLSAEITGWPPPFSFEWRRGSIPIASNISYSAAGYFQFVATNVPATVQYRVVVRNAAFSTGIASSPVNIITIAVTDANGNGIPDDYDAAYGITAGGPPDLDDDGMSNLNEYLAGTNPTNTASVLRIDIRPANGAALSVGLVPNKTYTIEYSDALGSGVWNKLIDFPARTTNRTETVLDPGGTPSRFYRVATPHKP